MPDARTPTTSNAIPAMTGKTRPINLFSAKSLFPYDDIIVYDCESPDTQGYCKAI